MSSRLRPRLWSFAASFGIATLSVLQASLLQAQVPPPPTLEELGEAPVPADPAPTGPAIQAPARQPNPNDPDSALEKPEPLLRGPVHEAFAEPYAADPQPGMIVTKQPPAPIEELPPEVRPEGDNVEWIPGYWGWDDERQDFVWVSGIWRATPPNHRWVPGYWHPVDGGFQWVAGAWMRNTAQEIEYLAKAPPATLELGPVGNAPGDNYFWIPGCWTWGGSSYLWRPGYWSIAYSNWVWVPARYYWTPFGYAYTPGYWDFPFASRGYLFAPYYFPGNSYLTVGFQFTPGITLSLGLLTNNFWVSPGYGHYFFGDYYTNYSRYGYQPWHQYHNSRHGYDPIFAYNQRRYSAGGQGNWNDRQRNSSYYQMVSNNFQQHVDNKDARPPHTWSEQIARAGQGNKTGPAGVQAGAGQRGPDGNQMENALGQSWRDVVLRGSRGEGNNPDLSSFTRLSDTQRDQLRKQANGYRQLSDHRRDTETNRGGGKANPEWQKLPGSAPGGPVPGGNNIAGSTGNGIQNRFRLPKTDKATQLGGDFGQADTGKRLKLEPVPGTGAASAGVGSRAQAYQDAIEKARRERDSLGNTSPNSNTPRNNDFGSRFGSPLPSQFDRSKSARPPLDNSQFDGSPGVNAGGRYSAGRQGTPGNTFTPRSNPAAGATGTSNRPPADSVQDAMEKARRAVSNQGPFNPNNSGPGTTRTLAPPSGNSKSFSSPYGQSKSFSPPGGSTRSFGQPNAGPGSSDRGGFQRGTPHFNGNSGGNGFRKGSSYTPGSQTGPTFGSTAPGSNVFGSSPEQGRNSLSKSRTFGGNSGGNSPPSFSRSNPSASHSSSGYRGPTSGGSKDSGSSSKPHHRGRD